MKIEFLVAFCHEINTTYTNIQGIQPLSSTKGHVLMVLPHDFDINDISATLGVLSPHFGNKITYTETPL
jgi:hypothetical protein